MCCSAYKHEKISKDEQCAFDMFSSYFWLLSCKCKTVNLLVHSFTLTATTLMQCRNEGFWHQLGVNAFASPRIIVKQDFIAKLNNIAMTQHVRIQFWIHMLQDGTYV